MAFRDCPYIYGLRLNKGKCDVLEVNVKHRSRASKGLKKGNWLGQPPKGKSPITGKFNKK